MSSFVIEKPKRAIVSGGGILLLPFFRPDVDYDLFCAKKKKKNSKYTLRKVSVGAKTLGGITKVIESYKLRVTSVK